MRFCVVAMAVGLGALGAAYAAEPGPSAPDPFELNNLGVKLTDEARYSEAETAYRQALDEWAKRGETPEAARNRAIVQENLGALLQVVGRYAESETVLTQALLQLQATTGESSPNVGGALERLAVLYRVKGEFLKAESCALRAEAMLPADEQAGNRVMLASIYVEAARFAEARTALETVQPGAKGWFAVAVNAVMAAAALGEEKLEDAERLAGRALDLAAVVLPPDDAALVSIWNTMGQVYRFQGRPVEAESSYRKAIEIWTAAKGPAHPPVAYALRNFAAFEHDRGREHAAEVMYQQAAAILEQALGKDDLQTLIARNELSEVYRAQGRYVAAGQMSRATLPAIQKLLPESDPRVLRALANYALLLDSTKRKADASVVRKHIQLVTQAMVDRPAR
jgi:tetratricopeptide (TPR) repeat protein